MSPDRWPLVSLSAALVAAPFSDATANVLTGLVLLAIALGWALLAMLSARFNPR
jgi:hypothetical protein